MCPPSFFLLYLQKTVISFKFLPLYHRPIAFAVLGGHTNLMPVVYKQFLWHSWLNVKSCISSTALKLPISLALSSPGWSLAVWLSQGESCWRGGPSAFQAPVLPSTLSKHIRQVTSVYFLEPEKTAFLLRSSEIKHNAAWLLPKGICHSSPRGGLNLPLT